MQAIGFVIPLLPGKADTDRAALASCWRGERKAAYEDARRRAGVTREAAWIQSAPTGDMAVIYLEADDLTAAIEVIVSSDEPFDCWFRQHVLEVHGVTLEEGFSPPEQVLDFRAEIPL